MPPIQRNTSEISEDIEELEYDLAIMHETGEDDENPETVRKIRKRLHELHLERVQSYSEEE